MEVKLPDKLTFKKREVIQLTKLDGRVLDFWESEFGGFVPVVNNLGEKFYTRRDVELILKIKRLLFEDKVEKTRIKEMLRTDTPPPSPKVEAADNGDWWPQRRDLIKSRLKEILTLLDKRDKK
jgi:DNA-binding transcriptional MerR regulator